MINQPASDPSHILLVHCSDEKGLVHKITGAIYRNGWNIIRNAEFVDPHHRQFFMRTEFSGELGDADLAGELLQLLPPEARIQLTRRRRKRIVILATKEPYCLGDLLLRHANDELNADIDAVISNHCSLSGLVARFDIPFHSVSHEGPSRQEHEEAVLALIDQFAPEYIVLAKYMRVLTPRFIEPFPNRIINIHHSFLPAFAGSSPYKQAFNRGVKIIGATAHFVTERLDEGPIIAQSTIPVDHTHNIQDLAQAGREIEKQVLANALRLVFEERVFVTGNKTVIFD